MAVVRELTTVLDFAVNPAGLVEAQTAVERLKASLLALGKLFGFVFAAEKIYELVDGLFSAGKEIAKLQYQITRMARAGDDIPVAMQKVFDIAQATGIQYTHALDTYREFLNESKELNVSQDQLLTTVENIYKGLRLGAAGPEQITQVLNAMNLGFRRGAIGMRQWGLLQDEAHDVTDAIGLSMGKTRDQMDEYVKAGKLSAKEFITALSAIKATTKIQGEFANRPRKLGEAFNYAWNEAARLSAAIWKITNVTGRVASAIVWVTKQIVAALEGFSNYFGGLKRTLEVLAILFTVAFGPKLLMMLALSTRALVLFTAKTIALGIASWRTLLPWLAIGAAVLAATALIIDMVAWMRGGKSIIGDYLGNFEDVKTFIENQFKFGDFLAPFRALQQFIEGDLIGAFNTLKEAIKTTQGELGLLAFAIMFAASLFLGWKTIKFLRLNVAIREITDAVKGLGGVADETAEKIANIWKMPAKPSSVPGVGGKPGAVPEVIPTRPGSVPSTTPATTTPGVGVTTPVARTWMQSIKSFSAGILKGFLLGIPLAATDWSIDRYVAKPNLGEDFTDMIRRGLAGGGIAGLIAEILKNPNLVTDTPKSDGGWGVLDPGNIGEWIKGFGERMWKGPENLLGPSVPGALPPGATQNNTNTVNQTNSFVIQIDPSLSIVDQIRNGLTSILEGVGRQAQNAMPVVEAPKQ
jgi:tape measure domain-containing protein